MAKTAKSQRGRGGGSASGKRDSTGNLISSSSSTPTASRSSQSVNVRALPSQYNYTEENNQPNSPRNQPPPYQPPLYQPPPFQPSTSHAQINSQNQHDPPPPNQTPVNQQPPNQPAMEQPPNQPAIEQPQGNLSLEALLTMRGREQLFPRLSPRPEEGLWFDRDETVLVKRVSKILKDKFDGPFYSWNVTPTDKQDRYFTQLAYHYTWDPMITPLVREQFDAIAQRRLKGLVSHQRTKNPRERPRWIREELFAEMEEYWNTEDAKERSTTASDNRNSQRDGLGIHKHVAGPRSFLQIEREMVVELKRPVSIGEVFKRTHTRKDGTYVDEKAKLIGETYEKNLEARLSQIGVDNLLNSDGTSQPPELTADEMNAIFIESTIPDERGNPYGLGRLSRIHGKGKDKWSSSSTISDLQEQLKQAKKKIEEQEAENVRRDAELARREAESQQQKSEMEMIVSYLKEKDPALAAWMDSRRKNQAAPPTGSYATPPTRLEETTPSSSVQ